MTQPSPIPNTRLTGSQTTPLPATTSVWMNAKITIDRTVTGGLNSLTAADTLEVNFDYQLPGDTAWMNVSGSTWQGGVMTVVKNGTTFTQNTEELAIGRGSPFPVGTAFRLNTTASTPVRIAGTVVYS
jgi:hypothetical protein